MIALGLAGIVVLAWAYLVFTAHGMSAEVAMPHMYAWSAVDLLLLFLMWASMMAALMLPAAAPMILTVSSVQRRWREGRRPYVNTAFFAAGTSA